MPTHKNQVNDAGEVRWISDKTKVTLGLVSALAICGSIIASTWAVRGYVEAWRAELGDHFSRLELSQTKLTADVSALGSKWSINQMGIYSGQLDKFNRTVLRADGSTGLIVPAPENIPSRP